MPPTQPPAHYPRQKQSGEPVPPQPNFVHPQLGAQYAHRTPWHSTSTTQAGRWGSRGRQSPNFGQRDCKYSVQTS